MSEHDNRNMIPSKGGFFGDLLSRAKLIIRLMADNRVNPLLKAIPVGSLVYLFLPLDVPGPIDDAAIIWLGMYLFVEMCPQDIVEEHMRNISRTSGTSPEFRRGEEDEIIDGEFEEKR